MLDNQWYSPTPSQPNVNLLQCLYKGTERKHHDKISHYSLYLGNLETQTVQGRTVPSSPSYSGSILHPCFPQAASPSSSLASQHGVLCCMQAWMKTQRYYLCLCSFARVVIIKYHGLGSFKKNVFLSQFWSSDAQNQGFHGATFTPKALGKNLSLPLPASGIPWLVAA